MLDNDQKKHIKMCEVVTVVSLYRCECAASKMHETAFVFMILNAA